MAETAVRTAASIAGEDRPLVYSVVLTFNNLVDTEECLRSLLDQDYQRHRVIVVDNGSSDGSLAALKSGWQGRVEFVETGANLGVAAGYNAGIRPALAAGAAYVTVCNNDIVAEPEFVGTLVETLRQAPNAALAGPVITYFDKPGVVWFARITQHSLFCFTRHRYRDQPLARVQRYLDATYASDFVPTCSAMISRRALEEVGLLDERFFFGHDEVDWCLRARKKGFVCLVSGRALVRHKVSVTAGGRGSNILRPRAAYTHASTSILIGAKHFRRLRAVPFLIGLLALRLPVNLLGMALTGNRASIPPFLRGIRDGLRRYGPAFLQPAGRE